MDDEDFPLDEARRLAGEAALEYFDALEVPEVQETLMAWTQASHDLIRALERQGLPPRSIAGTMGGAVLDAVLTMGEA